MAAEKMNKVNFISEQDTHYLLIGFVLRLYVLN